MTFANFNCFSFTIFNLSFLYSEYSKNTNQNYPETAHCVHIVAENIHTSPKEGIFFPRPLPPPPLWKLQLSLIHLL